MKKSKNHLYIDKNGENLINRKKCKVVVYLQKIFVGTFFIFHVALLPSVEINTLYTDHTFHPDSSVIHLAWINGVMNTKAPYLFSVEDVSTLIKKYIKPIISWATHYPRDTVVV